MPKTNEKAGAGNRASGSRIEIGVDSFAAQFSGQISSSESVRRLVQRIVLADQAGLNIFGVGEHHRKEYLDSAPLFSGRLPPRRSASGSPVRSPY